jgi:colanic acid/amylovoran biosynthesis protein
MKILITNATLLNTGDAAILLGTCDILRRAFGASVQFTVYDAQAATSARYYPELRIRPALYSQLEGAIRSPWRRKGAILLLLAAARFWGTFLGRVCARRLPPSLRASLAEYAAADLVVSSGGTYLVPYYRTFPKLLAFLVAAALRRPLVLFTQSLGPFPRERRWLLRYALRRAQCILVRDRRSRDELVRLGVRPERIAECSDSAFALAAPPSGLDKDELPDSPLRVAVSVRDWPHFRDDRAGRMEAYLDAVAAAVRRLVKWHHADVTFLSTCQGVPEYWTDDSRVADSVLARLPPDVRARVRVDHDFHTPGALRERLGRFDAVIATRMHVAILAMCARVPVLPIAYEFKTVELFKRLDPEEPVPHIESVAPKSLCRSLDHLLERAKAKRQRLERWVEEERLSAFSAGALVKSALTRADERTPPGLRPPLPGLEGELHPQID